MLTSERIGPDSLAGDQRGVILVIGIVAGVALVGGLYFMISMGDAVVWRQSVQDAADAAAFHNSVIQARGMNVVVTLNMVMAIVMALLVAFRVLEMLVFTGLALATIACAIPPGLGCGMIPTIANFQARLLKIDKNFSPRIAKICAAINVAEKATATVVPPVAMLVSSIETSVDYDGIAFAASPSIVAPTLDSMRSAKAQGGSATAVVRQVLAGDVKKKITDCFNKKPKPKAPPPKTRGERVVHFGEARWKDMSQQRMGVVFSLPVMEDKIHKLCAEASRYGDEPFLSLLGLALPSEALGILQTFSGIKAKLIQAAPSLFCTPMTGPPGSRSSAPHSLGDIVRDDMHRQVDASCKQAEKDFQTKPDEQRKKDRFYKEPTSAFDSDVDPLSGFDRKKCRAETKKKQETDHREARKREQENAKKLNDIMECVKPAKVWEMSRNGNLFMQSFSWGMRGAPRTAALAPIGVPGGVAVPSPGPVRAQAEMYFDCSGDWYGACDANAMWQPRWRARLRRIAPLSRMAGDAAALVIGTGISHGIARFLGDLADKKLPVVGNDIKQGNVLNYPRDWFAEKLYDNNPLQKTQGSTTLIH